VTWAWRLSRGEYYRQSLLVTYKPPVIQYAALSWLGM